jgi:hypothetical protein
MIDPMHALEILKDAAKVAQKIGQLGLQKQILEAENEVRELTREKRHLEDKVEELERNLKLRAAMAFTAPFYYRQGDVTPFCPACYEGCLASTILSLQRQLEFPTDYGDSFSPSIFSPVHE